MFVQYSGNQTFKEEEQLSNERYAEVIRQSKISFPAHFAEELPEPNFSANEEEEEVNEEEENDEGDDDYDEEEEVDDDSRDDFVPQSYICPRCLWETLTDVSNCVHCNQPLTRAPSLRTPIDHDNMTDLDEDVDLDADLSRDFDFHAGSLDDSFAIDMGDRHDLEADDNWITSPEGSDVSEQSLSPDRLWRRSYGQDLSEPDSSSSMNASWVTEEHSSGIFDRSEISSPVGNNRDSRPLVFGAPGNNGFVSALQHLNSFSTDVSGSSSRPISGDSAYSSINHSNSRNRGASNQRQRQRGNRPPVQSQRNQQPAQAPQQARRRRARVISDSEDEESEEEEEAVSEDSSVQRASSISNTRQIGASSSNATLRPGTRYPSRPNSSGNAHFSGTDLSYPSHQSVSQGPAYMAALAASHSFNSARARASTGNLAQTASRPTSRDINTTQAGPSAFIPAMEPFEYQQQRQQYMGSSTNLPYPLAFYPQVRPGAHQHHRPRQPGMMDRAGIPMQQNVSYMPYPSASRDYTLSQPGNGEYSVGRVGEDSVQAQRQSSQLQNTPAYPVRDVPHALDMPVDHAIRSHQRLNSADSNESIEPKYPSSQNARPGHQYYPFDGMLRNNNSNVTISYPRLTEGINSNINNSSNANNINSEHGRRESARDSDRRRQDGLNTNNAQRATSSHGIPAASSANTIGDSLMSREPSNITHSNSMETDGPSQPVANFLRNAYTQRVAESSVSQQSTSNIQQSSHQQMRSNGNRQNGGNDRRRETNGQSNARRSDKNRQPDRNRQSTTSSSREPIISAPPIPTTQEPITPEPPAITYDDAGYINRSESDLATPEGRRWQRVIDYRRRNDGVYDPDSVVAESNRNRGNNTRSSVTENARTQMIRDLFQDGWSSSPPPNGSIIRNGRARENNVRFSSNDIQIGAMSDGDSSDSREEIRRGRISKIFRSGRH